MALIRISEKWRSIGIANFEKRQLEQLWDQLGKKAEGRDEAGHETNLNPDSYLQQKSDLTGVVETEYILAIRAGANGNGNDVKCRECHR